MDMDYSTFETSYLAERHNHGNYFPAKLFRSLYTLEPENESRLLFSKGRVSEVGGGVYVMYSATHLFTVCF